MTDPERATYPERETVMQEVRATMVRQHEKYGRVRDEQSPLAWSATVMEPVGRAAEAILDTELAGADPEAIETALIETAAIAVEAVVNLRRRRGA